jgi:hypothetical protein
MRAVESMPSFRGLMFTYVEAFIEQVLVSVACNGAHSLKQRLARWLLMMRDRSVLLPRTCRPKSWESKGRLSRMPSGCERYRLVRERIAQRLPKTYPEKRIRLPPLSVIYITDNGISNRYAPGSRGGRYAASTAAKQGALARQELGCGANSCA